MLDRDVGGIFTAGEIPLEIVISAVSNTPAKGQPDMPSRRKGGDLILFSSEDPQPLVGWLVDTFGLQAVLQALSNHRPGEAAAPAKRAARKGGKRKGRPRGSKKGSKKGGAKKA